MISVSRNILANLFSKGWSAVMGLAFVPFYILLLGMEAYGLIGLFATLQVIFSLLDLGITTTLNRELARYSALSEKAQEMRNLLRTFEIIYWGLAILIGLIIYGIAPFIAHDWVNTSSLAPAIVTQSIRLMGLVLAFQFPLGFYAGGLLGLQHQVLNSLLQATDATLRFGGVVLVLWLIQPTLQVFFGWQALVSMVSTLLTVTILWRIMPHAPRRARFDVARLQAVWRFAAGMLGISSTAILLTQMDKIVLSKVLPLEQFGYYSLAGVLANGVALLTTPVFNALFPRFSQLVVIGDQAQLRETYHRSCQIMAVIIIPVTVILACFAPEILFLWTRNPTTVAQTHLLVTLLVTGTALNGLMNLPYALQLAHGWTSLVFWINIVSILIFMPLIFVLTSFYGAVGAAIVWCGLNGMYVLVQIQIMHQRLLPGEQWRWYRQDVVQPLVVALVVAGLGRWWLPTTSSMLVNALLLLVIATATFFATALSVTVLRQWMWAQLKPRLAGLRHGTH
ncbi:lipopolysaccharide biosynthesis protein [Candidatus Oscillochloris fontis]|uniref:lipopolysaccharide biosynthesis protein n=1 Tax=Candidatus Oscillochloris fontis TaxID=2496868 RepID=UPI00101C4ED5|nr:oligosaccharide flippase family protein [Candidatus Oscillochloris fontis]